MNTQNSQTAATPTAGTWFENLGMEQLRARKIQHMRMAQLENALMKIIASEYEDDELTEDRAGTVADAALWTRHMIASGFINTPAMYELAFSVQALAQRVDPARWERVMPKRLPALESLQQQSAEILAGQANRSENVL
jgi:hypothetical protein